MEADYISLSYSMRDLLPLRWFIQEVGNQFKMEFEFFDITHSTVFEDNNNTLSLATASMATPSTRHIAMQYHLFIDYDVEGKGIFTQRVNSR